MHLLITPERRKWTSINKPRGSRFIHIWKLVWKRWLSSIIRYVSMDAHFLIFTEMLAFVWHESGNSRLGFGLSYQLNWCAIKRLSLPLSTHSQCTGLVMGQFCSGFIWWEPCWTQQPWVVCWPDFLCWGKLSPVLQTPTFLWKLGNVHL